MCGNVQMPGHLLAHGHRVQQIGNHVDPEGCVMRRLHVINRGQYRVPAPRSIWHIDGNHKLIRQHHEYCSICEHPFYITLYQIMYIIGGELSYMAALMVSVGG